MPPAEIIERQRRIELLSDYGPSALKMVDGCERLPPESTSIWVDSAEHPRALLAVAWEAGPLGLSHEVNLFARAVKPLSALMDSLPRGRGSYSLRCPFWTLPAIENRFRFELVGPEAIYLFSDPAPPHPAAPAASPISDEDLPALAYAFPRVVRERPRLVLMLNDTPAAVALTTHAAGGLALMGTHVPHDDRGHGFGSGVSTALCSALQAEGFTPVAEIAMANEPALRLCERLGGRIDSVLLRVTLKSRRLD